MSHKASSALAELKPDLVQDIDFRVLFHLCDAHNSKRPPDEACFPKQSTLLQATGKSNGGLNNALNRLEERGLIRRHRATAPGERTPRTYYILWCDFDILEKQTPRDGDGNEEQTPSRDITNSISCDNKLHVGGVTVDEPVSEPVKEQVSEKPLSLFGEKTEKKKSTSRPTEFPEVWEPLSRDIEVGIALGFTSLQVMRMGEMCADWHRQHAKKVVRHSAAFRNWMRREAANNPPRKPKESKPRRFQNIARKAKK